MPKPNLIEKENKALAELKRVKDMTMLTPDRGVAMVVLDKQDYLEKAQELLLQPAYRTIERDPTNKLKARIIIMFRKIKGTLEWMKNSTRLCTPQAAPLQDFMICPKSTKLAQP